MKKYILSQDVGILMGKWAERKAFQIPDLSYFNSLTRQVAADLQILFNEECKDVKVEIVLADDICKKINTEIRFNKEDFIVSLDRVYFECDFQFEICRVVSFDGKEWIDCGRRARPGSKSLEEQMDQIVDFANNRSIVLTDDGCWTNRTIKEIINGLVARGAKVKEVVFALFFGRDTQDFGTVIKPIYIFSDENVLDWVCERDFIPGVPLGGRTVVGELGDHYFHNVGAYYLFNMGDFRNWASLDFSEDRIKWFTKRRLYQAAELFAQIERLSSRPVIIEDMERIPFGLNIKSGMPFVALLEEAIKKI